LRKKSARDRRVSRWVKKRESGCTSTGKFAALQRKVQHRGIDKGGGGWVRDKTFSSIKMGSKWEKGGAEITLTQNRKNTRERGEPKSGTLYFVATSRKKGGWFKKKLKKGKPSSTEEGVGKITQSVRPGKKRKSFVKVSTKKHGQPWLKGGGG